MLSGARASKGARDSCATDESRKGGVCPPAWQAQTTRKPARKAVRGVIARFTTIPRALGTCGEHNQRIFHKACSESESRCTDKATHVTPPVSTDGFRPLPVSSLADSVSGRITDNSEVAPNPEHPRESTYSSILSRVSSRPRMGQLKQPVVSQDGRGRLRLPWD